MKHKHTALHTHTHTHTIFRNNIGLSLQRTFVAIEINWQRRCASLDLLPLNTYYFIAETNYFWFCMYNIILTITAIMIMIIYKFRRIWNILSHVLYNPNAFSHILRTTFAPSTLTTGLVPSITIL